MCLSTSRLQRLKIETGAKTSQPYAHTWLRYQLVNHFTSELTQLLKTASMKVC